MIKCSANFMAQTAFKSGWLNSAFSFPVIFTSKENIRLFHLFIFEIQLILEPQDQTSRNQFWTYLPKIFKISF